MSAGGIAGLVLLLAVDRSAPTPARPGRPTPTGASSVKDEARAITVARVEVRGLDRVPERQVDRILVREGLRPGVEVLWPADPRIPKARDRLRATGYFSSVALKIEAVPQRVDHVVLVVDLQERSALVLSGLYLGSSRMTPFHAGLAGVERNILGRGVDLGGAAIWGSAPAIQYARRQQAWRLSLEIPRLGRAPLGVRASGYGARTAEPYRVAGAEDDPDPRLFRAIDVGRLGGSVGLTFPVLPTLTMAVDYRFERVRAGTVPPPQWVHDDGLVTPVDLHLRRGVHRLTSAHFGLSWDGRDDVVLTGKGGRIALDLQLSSPAIGSQYEYIKLVVVGAYSFRLPWRHWLTPSLSGGQIAGRAPIFELYYNGDISPWTPGRELGVRYSTRNAIDVFRTGIGGRTYGVIFGRADLQYSIPLFRRTRTRFVYGGDLVFTSGVFTLVGDGRERSLRRAAGQAVAPIGFAADVGVRLDTAVGTLELSVGNLLRRTPL